MSEVDQKEEGSLLRDLECQIVTFAVVCDESGDVVIGPADLAA